MLLVVVGVEVGELDGVLDGLDLGAEAADVVVADVRDFLEREILDLALGELLEQVARLGVHENVVPGLEQRGPERVRDDTHAILIGPHRHHRALEIEHFLQDDDLALYLVIGGVHDVQALVEDELLARLQRLDVDRRVDADLHLAALGEDIDGPVQVGR